MLNFLQTQFSLKKTRVDYVKKWGKRQGHLTHWISCEKHGRQFTQSILHLLN